MMKKQNEQRLVPKLRFKGFSEDWEQRELHELVNFSKGKGYSKKDIVESGTPFMRYGNLYTDFEIEITAIKESVEEKPKSVKSKGGEILVPSSGETPGEIARASTLLKRNVIIGGDINILTVKNNNVLPTFLALDLNTNRNSKELSKYAVGNSVVHLYNKDLHRLKIYLPDIEIQKKIVSIWRTLDKLLTLHKRKSSQLKLLKKEMIKNSMTLTSLYPILRFSGFNDEWEISKIKDSFKERKNRNAGGQLLSVTLDDGVVPTSSLDRTVNTSEDKSNYKSVFKNDLVYNSMRMWQGASGISKLDGIVSPAYTVVTPIGNTLTDYFSYYFKRNDLIYKFRTHSQGLTSDTWTLRYIPFSEIKIRKPKAIEEQLKIFNFIKSIDDMLLINKNKIKLLNDIKKLYLDNLFI